MSSLAALKEDNKGTITCETVGERPQLVVSRKVLSKALLFAICSP